MNELKVNGTQKFMGIDIPIVEGGFGKDQKVILAKTVAEIHKVRMNDIQDLIKQNIDEFEIGVDLLDLCDENFKTDAIGLGFITSNRQKNCFLLSEESSTATCCPNVGLPFRISTATSKTFPCITLTSLV